MCVAREVEVNGQVIGAPAAWYFWPSATLREFAAILVDHRIVNGIACAAIILASVLKAL